MRVFVILPAAGLGTRMTPGHTSHTAPKQFLELAGTPILIRTLRAFAEVPEVSALIVAVRATEMERLTAHISEHGFADRVRVVEGGDSRQESVLQCAEGAGLRRRRYCSGARCGASAH